MIWENPELLIYNDLYGDLKMARGKLFSSFKLLSGCVYGNRDRYPNERCSGDVTQMEMLDGSQVNVCKHHAGELKGCQMILTTNWQEYRQSQLPPEFGGFL